jgi:RNA polymerase sigma-70 factor (ECF subfamily)
MTDARDPIRQDGRIDADIVARVLAGDTERYAVIVERYQRALYRLAVAMVLDHDAAADMVQDAFIRAYTNLKECRDPRRFRAWLFQTLRNRCLDYLKEPRRGHLRFVDAEPLLNSADGPASFVDQRELRLDITRALAQLPPEQREAFVMHYVDGMDYDTMADLLAVSISALKMRALRARQTLSVVLRTTDVTDQHVGSSSKQTQYPRFANMTAFEEER